MKKRSIKFGLVVFIFLQACQPTNGQKNTNHKDSQMEPTKNASSYKAGKDYMEFTRVKVLDKQGFDRPAEAVSILIPKGWTGQGEVIWTAPGQACSGTNMYFNAQSANGSSGFVILPNLTWSWSSDQQMNAFNRQHASGQFCTVGEPLDATQFLQNVWAKELGNATVSDIKINQDAIATMGKEDSKHRAELMRYGSAGVEFRHTAVTAKVKWPNGKSGFLFCKVTNIANYIPNMYNGTTSVSYVSSATRMIYSFPETEKDNSELVMTVVLASFRTNPEWKQASDNYWRSVREKKNIEHIGKIRLMDEQTKQIADRAIQNGNQRLAAMDNQMRNWEARQSTNDKIHNDFIKTIREVENYRDVNGKVELASGYNHAWSRGDGNNFIMTNNPNFNPASVFLDQNWKEMKKVD
jgi:hypothetical protein